MKHAKRGKHNSSALLNSSMQLGSSRNARDSSIMLRMASKQFNENHQRRPIITEDDLLSRSSFEWTESGDTDDNIYDDNNEEENLLIVHLKHKELSGYA